MARHRLLLADDSLTIQKVVNLTFADQGMEVASFSDGDSAAKAFRAVDPDIVLADVNMPGMNGYELCEMLKGDPSYQHVPVLLLVGSFEPFDREEAERVGANGHMTKPFSSIAELVSTVDALLAHSVPAKIEDAVTGPLPDTSDIESLYEKSLAEPSESAEGEFAVVENGLDDEMIQTSYVGAENEFVIENEYYSDQSEDTSVDDLSAASLETEPHGAGSEPGFAEYDIAASTTNGPFDSVAAEPSPVHSSSPATAESAGSLEEADLLELPKLAVEPPAIPNSGTGVEGSSEITRLSPELIDLIVDKVVERLSERGLAGDARSAPNS